MACHSTTLASTALAADQPIVASSPPAVPRLSDKSCSFNKSLNFPDIKSRFLTRCCAGGFVGKECYVETGGTNKVLQFFLEDYARLFVFEVAINL